MQRGYVQRDGRRLVPTETGFLVNDLLVEHFTQVLDYGFTAQLEERLDEIAVGQREWVPVVREFYVPFKQRLDEADQKIEKVDLGPQEIGRDCRRSRRWTWGRRRLGGIAPSAVSLSSSAGGGTGSSSAAKGSPSAATPSRGWRRWV
jgi:hypothetical protein